MKVSVSTSDRDSLSARRARFVVEPDRPLDAQEIPVKVDGRLVGTPRRREPHYWQVARGLHSIVAEVDGAFIEVRISVE